ncbi:hypothetical protein C8J56DRAFT_1042349 [Mycena floridula]|nr:hypothetical protein C8J56DRAFT_1042349 [Mycena floridula]
MLDHGFRLQPPCLRRFIPDNQSHQTSFNFEATLDVIYFVDCSGTTWDLISPSTEAYIWVQLMVELRRQLEEVTSDDKFAQFTARTSQWIRHEFINTTDTILNAYNFARDKSQAEWFNVTQDALKRQNTRATYR